MPGLLSDALTRRFDRSVRPQLEADASARLQGARLGLDRQEGDVGPQVSDGSVIHGGRLAQRAQAQGGFASALGDVFGAEESERNIRIAQARQMFDQARLKEQLAKLRGQQALASALGEGGGFLTRVGVGAGMKDARERKKQGAS